MNILMLIISFILALIILITIIRPFNDKKTIKKYNEIFNNNKISHEAVIQFLLEYDLIAENNKYKPFHGFYFEENEYDMPSKDILHDTINYRRDEVYSIINSNVDIINFKPNKHLETYSLYSKEKGKSDAIINSKKIFFLFSGFFISFCYAFPKYINSILAKLDYPQLSSNEFLYNLANYKVLLLILVISVIAASIITILSYYKIFNKYILEKNEAWEKIKQSTVYFNLLEKTKNFFDTYKSSLNTIQSFYNNYKTFPFSKGLKEIRLPNTCPRCGEPFHPHENKMALELHAEGSRTAEQNWNITTTEHITTDLTIYVHSECQPHPLNFEYLDIYLSHIPDLGSGYSMLENVHINYVNGLKILN